MHIDLDRQLRFLIEADKLKSVSRRSPLIDNSRRENSAEHSWHLGLYALVLAEHANEPVDIYRVLQMLLIHDLVEIDAGDFPIHSQNSNLVQQESERVTAIRLFGLLPERQRDELLALWQEFERGESSDARFAKGLDRFQPLIQNLCSGGGTWAESHVTRNHHCLGGRDEQLRIHHIPSGLFWIVWIDGHQAAQRFFVAGLECFPIMWKVGA